MPTIDILPGNATNLERTLSASGDPLNRLATGPTATHGWKVNSPPVSLFPWLIYEYGLGELSPYIADQAQLITLGKQWQRLRGTVSSVAMGLGWLGYTATIEEAPSRRTRWNLFQLALGRVRDVETPDLDRIEGIAGLSVALRSKFFRGFSGYDVRATETSYTKTSASILSNMSGARIRDDGALWSFGRKYEYDYQPTQAELTSLGVWIAPSASPFTWATSTFPWSLATFPWGATVNSVRKGLMAALLALKTCWVEFKDAGGNVIGYRKCRAVHQVVAATGVSAIFSVGINSFAVGTPTSEILYLEGMSGFGDGNGAVAVTAALRFDAYPADLTKPGVIWVGPGQLVTPLPAVAQRAVSIPFGRTVREQVKTLMRITV